MDNKEAIRRLVAAARTLSAQIDLQPNWQDDDLVMDAKAEVRRCSDVLESTDGP